MLIGREAERRAIERLVAGARVGSSGVLLITGEPGIGKTALVDEAATLAVGMRVLRARGAVAEREIPFGGLLQLLRPAIGDLDRIPAPQRDALAAALALRSGAAADRFPIGAATLSLICRYAESAPVALLIDDAHLLDRPSAEALLFAARRLLADPIMLLVSARAGESHPLAEADLPQLQLSGVDLEAAQRIVRDRSERVVPIDLVARLHRTVAGNPLALLELARDPEQLQRVPPGVPVPVPTLLAEAFVVRAGRLSPVARTALVVASVEDGELGIVARACEELGIDVTALSEAEQALLVTIADGRVEFRHPLVRSAVYASADPGERRAVHRAVAAALAGRDADRRAWHLSEAVLGMDGDVAAALEVAGDHAAQRGGHAVAATAFERAARLTPDGHDRARRLVAAGEAAWFAGLPERAEGLLSEALALGPPLPVRTRAQELRGDIAVKCGSPAQARDILVAAAAESAATDPDTAVGLLADVVNACFRLGDAASALQAGHDIEKLLDRTERPGTRILGLLASGIALVLAGRGGTDQIREAVRLAPSAGLDRDRRRQIWMVLAPLFLRESGTGRALIRQAMQERRDQVAVGMLPALLFQLARDDSTTDRWADAEASYDEGIRLSREAGQTTELAICLAGLAWLSAHQGKETDCRARAAEAIQICTERQIHLGLAWALFALGDLELGRGDPAEALPHFEQLLEVLTSSGVLDPDLSPAPELVDLYLRLGRADDAARTARTYAVRAVDKGQPWALARAARATGLVSAEDELDLHFESALALHERTLDVFETARTRLAYGARLRRARRRVDARAQLRLAVAAFDELGAVRWADLAAAELKATGETARRRELSTADELTPQERQIALLLADGQSIRAAAAMLFLSPKTVEYHLRKVYAKLGIHSRSELAEIVKAPHRR
jgi:DNA-binding CsgD family transcriptional regulator